MQDTAKGSIAQEAYCMITEIMHIDNTFDDLSVTDRKKQCQFVLSEKVDAYFAWAKQKYSQVTHNPHSPQGCHPHPGHTQAMPV